MGLTTVSIEPIPYASGGGISGSLSSIASSEEFESLDLGVAGSGSRLESFFSYQSGSPVPIRSLEPLAPITENHPTTDTRMAEVLDTIQSAFGMTWNELAQACGKQRRTLYNWRDGVVEPRPAAAERLFMLYRVARDWQSAAYPTPSRAMLRAPMFGDRSLFDLLTADKIERDAIDYIGAGMAIDSLERQPLADPFA